MRIAVDIDSTLHHYWDALAAAARRRFGVDLPYEDQRTWHVPRLKAEQLAACVAETHCERVVLAAEPYPGAVEAVSRWREAGHEIHVMSHRVPESTDVTRAWLERIGLPFDELRCDFQKVEHCVAVGVDLLVDDSPVNLQAAADAGIRVATIAHPWNRDVCDEEDVVCAPDWPSLERALAPLLAPQHAA